ncbi:hypothetical protein HOY80DRAFT_940345 [Tuber brumale]|nr:hypothetical protein HOY80DRAFT_940345 [Tuber brumale]
MCVVVVVRWRLWWWWWWWDVRPFFPFLFFSFLSIGAPEEKGVGWLGWIIIMRAIYIGIGENLGRRKK